MSPKLNMLGVAAVALLAMVSVGSESPGAPGSRRRRGELDPQTCAEDFDIQNDKIIRTEESREMGAKYLSELDVGAREECLRLCCETDSCDVFVFEEKSPGSCYLFNCGPPEDFKCKFTRHTNFSSGVLAVSRHLAELQDRVRLTKHEHDLASLKKSVASSAGPTAPAPPPTTARARQAAPSPAQRHCSPYQFECHGTRECIAIYNACDGVPQCADGSDEAPELGCPTASALLPPPPPPPRPPQRQPAPASAARPERPVEQTGGGGGEVPAPYLRPATAEYAASGPHWPHHLVQAQPAQLKPYEDNSPNSHIFNHKGGLLQEGESQIQQQFIPLETMQQQQWVRRPWQHSVGMDQMSMNDRQLMYRYGEQPVWKPAAEPVAELRPGLQTREKPGAMSVNTLDRDKMWAVPQNTLMKPESPLYIPSKTVPETPTIYSNQQGTLRDSPKKGFEFASKTIHSPKYEPADNNFVDEIQASEGSREIHKELIKNKNITPKESVVESKHEAGETKKEIAVKVEHKHDTLHDHYKMEETEDHDGLSEKPPGAILLLILGVLMTTIMAVMLGCRFRLARRRMRRAGKSPFAHDADYLVNGMYL